MVEVTNDDIKVESADVAPEAQPVQVEPAPEPLQEEESSWGSWFAKAATSVVRVVEDSTNKLGSSIQKFVEEEIDQVEVALDKRLEAAEKEEVTTVDTSSQQETTEETVESPSLMKTFEGAEQKVFKFLDDVYLKGRSIVTDTEELKYVTITYILSIHNSKVFDQVADSVKGAALYVFADSPDEDEASTIKIYVSFKELFIEFEGLKRIHDIQSIAKGSEVKLEELLQNLSEEQRDQLSELFEKIDELLDVSKVSTIGANDAQVSEEIQQSKRGQELDEIVAGGEKAAAGLVENFEVLSTSNADIQDVFTATLMLTEKSKAEGYRTLAKISAQAALHLLQIAEENSSDNETPDFDHQVVGSLIQQYVTLVTRRLVKVSENFSSTTQKVNALLSKTLTADPANSELKKKLDERTVSVCTQLIMQADKALSVVLGAQKSFNTILKYKATKKL
ncbi:exocyst complex component EXO70 [Acrasis kona]|uniref:Exocyst complex component EXO70 n=1 Tax=Acrasis kona TaxID=1008807 RepID=A0AAW2ZHN7_9EUKA